LEKNVRKSKRARGEAYIGTTGKCVPSKTFTPYECGCLRKCHNLIDEAKQKQLHTQYYDLGNHDLQSAFISGLVKTINKKRVYTKNVDSQKKFTMIYYLPIGNRKEERVCKSFFKNILSISDGRIARILAHKNISTTPPVDKLGKHDPHNKTSNLKIQAVVDFINRFPSYESHYSREKSVHRKYLAPDFNISCMYKLYKEETEDPVSLFKFHDSSIKNLTCIFIPLSLIVVRNVIISI